MKLTNAFFVIGLDRSCLTNLSRSTYRLDLLTVNAASSYSML